MKNPIKNVLIICCIYLNTSVFGQENSPLSMFINYSPLSSNQKHASYSMKLKMQYPVCKSSKSILLTGVNGQWFQKDLQDDSVKFNERYYLSIPLALLQNLNENYKLFFSFEIGLNSDFSNISKEHIKYTSKIALIKSTEKTIRWSAILILSHQYSGLSISPVFYVNCRVFSKLYFNGALPTSSKLTWKANANNQYGIAIITEKNSFYLPNDNKGLFVEKLNADIDLFYLRKLNKNLKFSAKLGYTFLHTAKIYDQGETVPAHLYIFDNSSKKSVTTQPKGLIFKVGVFWSLSD